MDRPFLKLANAVYRATPFRPLRQLYFDAFAKLVRNRVVRADVDGMQYQLDLGEMIDLALYLRQFEPAVRTAIRSVTRPGMTVLDIGANVGAHTLLLASLVGREGRVIAFEPMEYAFVKLRRNVGLNAHAKVEVVRAALADEAARDQRLHFRSSWRPDGTRADAPSTTDLIRLDDWASTNNLRSVDVMKIDVDGAEFGAISGGLQTIARSRPTILMEAVGPHFDDEARNPYRLLASLGYTFRDISSERELTLDTLRRMLPRNDPGMTVSLNVIARLGDHQRVTR